MMLSTIQDHIQQKRFNEAFKSLKEFLQANEFHEEGSILFLALGIDLHIYDEALDQALKIYEEFKPNALFQILLGRIYFHLKQTEKASKHLLIGYALNPRIEANHQLVTLYHQRMERIIPCDAADVVFVTGGYFISQGFHGDSLKSKAMGGSESALISLAKEWQNLGRKVVVYCNCDQPGVYDEVVYRPNWEFFYARHQNPMNLLIALRYDEYLQPPMLAKHKILWLQDVPQTRLYAHLTGTGPRADEIVFLSQSHEKAWREHFNFQNIPCFASRNGFDPALMPEAAIENGNEIIYASRPSRGLDLALRIHKKLREQGITLKLKICTYTQAASLDQDTEYQPYLKYQNDPDIVFLGVLSKTDLACELSKSLFMLYPNTTNLETSCMAAIEAMAAGCPVITSDRGALAETVPDGIGGAIVAYCSDQDKLMNDFVEKCRQFTDDRMVLNKLKKSCMDYASNRFAWKNIAGEWETHFFKGE